MPTSIIDKVSRYCTRILLTKNCRVLPFHDLTHTQQVVNNVIRISEALVISEREKVIVEMAACFHDTGFSKIYLGHEDESKKIAYEYLGEAKFNDKDINLILSCIEATKIPQKPKNNLAKILCDADLYHLSSPDFFYRNLLLRLEWDLLLDKRMSDLEWHILTLKFLEEHQYQTTFGRNVLEKGKRKNVDKIKHLLRHYNIPLENKIYKNEVLNC